MEPPPVFRPEPRRASRWRRFRQVAARSLCARRHVPKEEIVLAAMTLSAELRLATPLKLAIHPQFEAFRARMR